MRDIGIFCRFGYELPLSERLELIAAAGFEATCLYLGPDEKLVATGQADQMPGLARRCGLKVDNVHAAHAGCNALWSQTEGDGVVETYDTAIAFCCRHKIPVTVIHVTHGANPPPVSQIGVQRIRGLAERAERQNVVLAIENSGRPDYVDFLLSHCDASSVGLCYDSSHDFLTGMRPTEILKQRGRRLVTTHLSDNRGEHDDHWLPGEGTIDWEQVVSCFPKATYSGPVMLEVAPGPGDQVGAEGFLHKAYARVRQIAEKLG